MTRKARGTASMVAGNSWRNSPSPKGSTREIDRPGQAVEQSARRGLRLDWDAKPSSEIVSGAEREDSEGNVAPHQAIDHVVVGPVATRRDERIRPVLGCPACELNQVLGTL